MQVIECWTAAEWDRPGTRVTLGVMSLGSQPRFSPGFLDAAESAIRENDVHFLTGFFGTPPAKSATFARLQSRLEGMRLASHGGWRHAAQLNPRCRTWSGCSRGAPARRGARVRRCWIATPRSRRTSAAWAPASKTRTQSGEHLTGWRARDAYSHVMLWLPRPKYIILLSLFSWGGDSQYQG